MKDPELETLAEISQELEIEEKLLDKIHSFTDTEGVMAAELVICVFKYFSFMTHDKAVAASLVQAWSTIGCTK